MKNLLKLALFGVLVLTTVVSFANPQDGTPIADFSAPFTINCTNPEFNYQAVTGDNVAIYAPSTVVLRKAEFGFLTVVTGQCIVTQR